MKFNLTRHIRRTSAAPYMGPAYWQEPCPAPSVRETYRDLDGLDAAARRRAAIIRARKT
jgi:hypothetical protein